MTQKYLKITFPFSYKVELTSNIYGQSASTIKITDTNGNVVYSDSIGTRGHTLYVFNSSIKLLSKTNYDSYGNANTTGITNVLSKYMAETSDFITLFYFIITYDAITNDSDFNTLLNNTGKSGSDSVPVGFKLGKNIICSKSRNSFCFAGIQLYSGNSGSMYEFESHSEYSIGSNSTLTTHIVKKKSESSYPYALSRSLEAYTRLYPSTDTTQAIGLPYATRKVGNTLTLKNATLYTGRTYYIKVKFRTRGDGNSTSSKCSSIGFITYWNNWANSRAYIHNSATAYSEIGKIVEWTYSFTVDEDVQPTNTSLYFIIQNGWANGNDGQTIDLYYAKYWDSEGNVYSELYKDFTTKYGYNESYMLKINSGNQTYYTENILKISELYVYEHRAKLIAYDDSLVYPDRNYYGIRDTLEKYTYSELEKNKYKITDNKIKDLDYLNLYSY